MKFTKRRIFRKKFGKQIVGWTSKRTLPNGRVIYARDYGCKGWPIYG